MIHCNKYRIYLVTFILLTSYLTGFFIPTKSVLADDNFTELFQKLSGMHPYITAGWYVYNGSETVKIKGNITFNLYFTSTLASQTSYQDEIKLTLYNYKTIGELFFIKEVENGNKTIKLEPELFGEVVQNYTFNLENINLTLRSGDILIFSVEVIQSDKPIGNLIERSYEKNLKNKIRNIADFLNKSSSEELANLGGTIIEVLNISEESGISGEEIASLANSFSSSSFVYNSKDYPSSVYLSFISDKNLTLYFYSMLSEDFDLNNTDDSEILGTVMMLEEIPNGSVFTWPTRLFNLDPSEPINTEEWLIWFSFWLEYILMGEPSENVEINKITYYLNNENKLTTSKPEGDMVRFRLTTEPTIWDGISITRNKIITNLTADLYIYYSKLLTLIKKSIVNLTLFDVNTNISIASVEKVIDRSTLIELIMKGPTSPTTFEFNDLLDKEIWYNQVLGIKISVNDILGLIDRPTYILYNSNEYPSSITLTYEDTDNIKITDDKLENKEVIPGGSAKYILNIYSLYNDTININVSSKNPTDLDKWSIDYIKNLYINPQENKKIYVYVNSTDNTKSAYGEEIELIFNITGLTGFDTRESITKVSENAVDYNIEIISPSCKNIKHGESGTYNIIIRNRNTGFWNDTYIVNVTSEHDWTLIYDSFIPNLDTYDDTGDEYIFNITLKVPKFIEISEDKLKIIIKSQQSIEHNKEKIVIFNITTNVIKPNIFEKLYNYFQGIGEEIGLDSPLGDYAGGFLLFMVIFIIFIFIILIIYLLTKKYVEIICLDRIKEITPDEIAKFNITIKNPTKVNHIYEITAIPNPITKNWDISIDKNKTNIDPNKSEIIELSVKPNDYIKNNDWVEVKITANMYNSKKSNKISILTSIKDPKPVLNIFGVFHWPTNFKKGDKVITSFRLINNGNVSLNNLSIILYINNVEKNKVEEINIPRGGYAEVEIPWIAEKGKNEVNIVVK